MKDLMSLVSDFDRIIRYLHLNIRYGEKVSEFQRISRDIDWMGLVLGRGRCRQYLWLQGYEHMGLAAMNPGPTESRLGTVSPEGRAVITLGWVVVPRGRV